MALEGFNLVSFTPDDDVETSIFLKLDGDFSIGTGVRPNVTRAKVPHYEFARFGGNPLRRGTLKFWYSASPLGGKATGTPDVAYTGMRIVEVQPSIVGEVRKGPPVPIVAEWLLFIADERERLTPPRGGRLTLGILNPALADETADNGDDDTATPPPAPGATPVPPSHRTARELVKECLAAAGTTRYEIIWPSPEPTPPTDLKWLGSYATVELEKLLEYTHSVYCPQTGGAVLINRVGEGPLPNVPLSRRVVDQFMPPTDRRGEVVIFSSAPVPAVETRIIEGPSPKTWEFVIQDKSGKWREINDAQLRTDRLIHQGGPEKTVKEKYANVDVLYQSRVRSQLYHCIRLARAFFDPKLVGPAQSQILRRRISTAGKLNDIEVLATIAQPDLVNGGWKNAKEPARCNATFLNAQQNIIIVEQLLGKLRDANPAADLETNFVALTGAAAAGATTPAKSADLRVKLSIEQSVEVKDKNTSPADAKRRKPAFYTVGFRRGLDAGAIIQLTEGELTSEIDSPSEDTVFISRPELRLVADFTAGDTKPPVHNHDELDKKAKVLASRYLKERRADRAPRTLQVKGFYRAELNGRISEVRITQSPPTTTIKVDSVWTPLGPGDITQLIAPSRGGAGGGGGGPAEPYPLQAQTMNETMGLGGAGATQPVVPIGPPVQTPQSDGSFVARISSSSELPDLDQGTPEDPVGANQWSYSFVEQTKAKAGYGGWATLPGGREGQAFNWVEDPNHHSGLQGNGVNTANLAGTGLKLQPVPTGVRVRMYLVNVPAVPADENANPPTKEIPAKTEYWFGYETGIDGSCT